MNELTMRSNEKNKNIPGNKLKWIHNKPKPMVHKESSPEREVNSIQAYLKKIEKSQINGLTLHLQELEELQQTNPREGEGRK